MRDPSYLPRTVLGLALLLMLAHAAPAEEQNDKRLYQNRLTPIANPAPILADYPEFVEPVREHQRRRRCVRARIGRRDEDGMRARVGLRHATEGTRAVKIDFSGAAVDAGRAAVRIHEVVGPSYSPGWSPTSFHVAAFACHYRWLKFDAFVPGEKPVRLTANHVPLMLPAGASVVALKTADVLTRIPLMLRRFSAASVPDRTFSYRTILGALFASSLTVAVLDLGAGVLHGAFPVRHRLPTQLLAATTLLISVVYLLGLAMLWPLVRAGRLRPAAPAPTPRRCRRLPGEGRADRSPPGRSAGACRWACRAT